MSKPPKNATPKPVQKPPPTLVIKPNGRKIWEKN